MKIKHLFCCVVFFLSCVLAISASAAIVGNLYQGEVPVAGQTPADWQKALPEALKQVLVKLTGNPQIDQVTAVHAALAKAGNYVQSYNYSTLAVPQNNLTESVQIRFSQRAITRLLQQANQAQLPNNRPSVLVWLAVPDEKNQPKAIYDSSDATVASFQKAAETNAIPLVWPTMDLQDISALSANQIWNQDLANIQAASGRYHADKILVGHLQKSGNQWQGNWILISDAGNQTWQTQGADMNQAAVSVLDFVNRQTAGLNNTSQAIVTPNSSTSTPVSIVPATANGVPATLTQTPVVPPAVGGGQTVTMKVDGIHGLDDYASLLNYLRSLSSVAEVDTEQMNDDNLVLDLKVNGTPDMLIKDLSVGGKLTPEGDAIDHGSVMNYHWTGTAVPSTATPSITSTPSTVSPMPATPTPNQTDTIESPAPTSNQNPQSVPSVPPAIPSGPVYTTPPSPAQPVPMNDQQQGFKPDKTADEPE